MLLNLKSPSQQTFRAFGIILLYKREEPAKKLKKGITGQDWLPDEVPFYSAKDSKQMALVNPPGLEFLTPRIKELLSAKSPWHRRNWRPSTSEILRKFIEESNLPGTKEPARNEMKQYVQHALGQDPGVSDNGKDARPFLDPISKHGAQAEYARYCASEYSRNVSANYLSNWANVFRDNNKLSSLDVEGTSKRIISHAVDQGLSPQSLFSIIEELEQSPSGHTISDFLEIIDERLNKPRSNFSFLVPIRSRQYFLYGQGNAADSENWLTVKEFKAWLYQNNESNQKRGIQAALKLNVEARDINEAVSLAQQKLILVEKKFSLGSKSPLNPDSDMWSVDRVRLYPTTPPVERFRMFSFERADALSSLEVDPELANILTMLEPLHSRDAHLSVIAGWAAIESLLTVSPEKDILGAERFARIVAARYFRNELSWLSNNYAKAYKGKASEKILKAEKSIDRAQEMYQLIATGDDFSKLSPTDQLSVKRLAAAVRNPKREFDNTAAILGREFKRLYRKRNLIVHSGQIENQSIEAISRNLSPVLNAGFDQILSGYLVDHLSPKEFAARVWHRGNQLSNGNSENSPGLSILSILDD